MDRKSFLGLLGALAVAAVLPLLISGGYGINLLNLAVIYSLLTLSFFVIYGLTGIFAISQVAFWAIGAYTSGILTAKLHWPFWGGLVAAVALSALAGLLLGLPTLKLRSHYLTMATIGFAEAVRIVAHNSDKLTGGPNGMGGIPAPKLGPLVFNSPFRMYYLGLFFLALVLIALTRLKYSRLGRAMESIRDDELAAEAMGVNVHRIKVLSFVISAAVGGIAGPLYASLMTFIGPDAFTLAVTIQVIAMLLIGGRSSIPGAVAGAVLLTYLPEWLRGLQDWYMAIYGLGLLLILILLPEGLAGGAQKVRNRLARARGGAEPAKGGAAR